MEPVENGEQVKVCSRCKVEKDASCFTKNKSNKSGLSDYCKECSRLYAALYRQSHKSMFNNACKTWREKNKDKVSTYNKKYRLENTEANNVRLKKYRQDNPEKIKLMAKEWKRVHREIVKQYNIDSSRKNVDNLTDSYLNVILKQHGWIKETITSEVLNVTKEIIKIKRICKRKKLPKI